MNSHELAKELLALPNRHVTIAKPEGGPYVQEYDISPPPWEDLFGCIRMQIKVREHDVERLSEGE